MGEVVTCRSMVGTSVSPRRLAAVAVSLSLVAILLGACQAPETSISAAPSISASRAILKHPPSAPPPDNQSPDNPAAFGKSDGDLIGLADRDLSAALGEPTHVRRDEPAEIWQYAGQDCVLDFYLYHAGANLQVAYVEARDRRAQSEGTARCVRSLMRPTTAAVQKTADASE